MITAHLNSTPIQHPRPILHLPRPSHTNVWGMWGSATPLQAHISSLPALHPRHHSSDGPLFQIPSFLIPTPRNYISNFTIIRLKDCVQEVQHMADMDRAALGLQEQDLRGKVAVVTGATKGIGRAICIELATRGASILGTYSSKESAHLLDTLSQSINSLYTSSESQHDPNHPPPKLVGVVANITSPGAPLIIQKALLEHFPSDHKGEEAGILDILIFNAAVMGLWKMGEGAVTRESISSALVGNVQFPVLLMELLVAGKYFRRNSRVVAVSSEGVRARRPDGGAVYAATKAAIECLMRKWADELGTRPGMEGTTFNSVSVGFTKTEAYSKIPEGIREQLTVADAAEVAVGNRIGEVEDIAGVVGLLVSQKAGWISGSVVDASGGKAKIM